MDKIVEERNHRVVVRPGGGFTDARAVCETIRAAILRLDGVGSAETICDKTVPQPQMGPEHYLTYADLKDVAVDGKHYEVLLTIKQKEEK